MMMVHLEGNGVGQMDPNAVTVRTENLSRVGVHLILNQNRSVLGIYGKIGGLIIGMVERMAMRNPILRRRTSFSALLIGIHMLLSLFWLFFPERGSLGLLLLSGPPGLLLSTTGEYVHQVGIFRSIIIIYTISSALFLVSVFLWQRKRGKFGTISMLVGVLVWLVSGVIASGPTI